VGGKGKKREGRSIVLGGEKKGGGTGTGGTRTVFLSSLKKGRGRSEKKKKPLYRKGEKIGARNCLEIRLLIYWGTRGIKRKTCSERQQRDLGGNNQGGRVCESNGSRTQSHGSIRLLKDGTQNKWGREGKREGRANFLEKRDQEFAYLTGRLI